MALISAASAVASAEKVSIDGFRLVAEPTKADAYSIGSLKPDVGQNVLGPSVEFVFNGDVQIEHDRGVNYSSLDSSLATALYLATKSDWGTWQAGFQGNLDLRQTYTEATNSSVNAAVLRMESGTSATIDGNLTVGLDAATKIDPQAVKSSVSLAQGIRIYNYPGMSFQPQGSLTVSGQTAISVANGQYASVGIVTISSYSSAYDPYGSRAGDITLQFGSKELTAPALNIDVKRGRNAIGILFATEDKDSSMTVLGDTVIKAGFAEKMLNDNADSSKTFSKIVNSKDGDIANIGLWNEKGTNVFDGKLQISLFAANEKDTLNFGIVSDGGVVSVKDGLIIDAYAGENENSDLLDSGSDRFRAIELMNGASLEVHSRENASVIRSNIYLSKFASART